MKKTPAILLVLAAALAYPGGAGAVSPRNWQTTGVDGWRTTERDSVGITSEGAVGMSLAVEPVEGVSGSTVWALLRDGKDVLAATGDDGILYRIGPSGKAEPAARVIQPEITALGRDGSGAVLLGTAPDGVLYRLRGKEAVPVADTPETYIWRILPAGGGGAVFTTGGSGKIYRLLGDNRVEVVADLGATHVTGLLPRNGGWLATTESPGRLYQVGTDGSASVLYDADEPELRAPVLLADGSIFFLANPGDSGGQGKLYRRNAAGGVERVWQSLGGFVYDLFADRDGSLWVTTGSDSGSGAVVMVRPGPPSSWMEEVKVTEPQVLCALLDDPAHRFIGTGGLGKVYRVPGPGAYRGRVLPDPEDAGGDARWGALTLTPGGDNSGVAVETRSGNTKSPDKAWSDWAGVALAGGRGPVASPAARFLQWRLTLSDPGARVQGVSVAYLPANLAPQVSEVSVSDLGADLDLSWDRGQPASLTQDLAGGVHVEFQVPQNRNPQTPAAADQSAWARRYRTVTWKADDPNGDPLRYRVEIRGQGEAAWKPLRGGLTSTPWVWDSATVPDGWYLLRLVASDRDANPPGQADSAYRATEPFLVDNTPPEVRQLAVSGTTLTGAAHDAASPIGRLEMALDGREWRQIFPADGIPDMPDETIRLDLGALPAGDHVVLVRAFDEAGNMGIGRAGFVSP